MIFRTFVVAMAAAVVAAVIALPVQAQEVERSITNVAGDVYSFKNKFHISVFVVTEDGIVFGDPINADAATAAVMTARDQKTHSHGKQGANLR